MSNSLQYPVHCGFCNEVLHLPQPFINLIVCASCSNVNRIQDQHAFQFTDYNLKNKFRLSEVLKDLQYVHPTNGLSSPITGILEMEYNEGSLYFLYLHSSEPRIFVFFEYQWYEALPCNETVTNIKPTSIKPGKIQQIFTEPSYVIQREHDNKLALAGSVYLPATTDIRHIIEHVQDQRLFFSFWSEKVYKGSMELREIDCPVNQTDFLHYPLTHTCAHCHKESRIEGFPYIRSFVCDCGMQYSITGFGDVKEEGKIKTYTSPYIPLKSDAYFNQETLKVIGHCRKTDAYGFEWDEFTLWNAKSGFLYLSVYNGHWLKLQQIKLKNYVETARTKLAKHVFEGDDSFDLFNDYKASLSLVSGQFSGNIFNDGRYEGVEYTAPPQVWTFEKPEHEGVAAFKGEHVSKEQLQQAFAVVLDLPPQIGIGMAQPFKGGMSVRRMTVNLILGFLAILAVQFASNLMLDERIVYEGTKPLSKLAPHDALNSEQFTLDRMYNNLEVDLYSDVSNNWMETDMEVTNLNTGKTYNSELGVEYYSGYDGESWSEGSTRNNFVFSALPKGKYQMVFTPSFDTLAAIPPTTFTVTVKTGVNMYRNFGILLLLVGIPAIIYGFYNYNREYYRWSNSNYSPFETE